jgi:histidinol-phosphate aminotransferase
MSVYWSSLAASLSPYVPGEQPQNSLLIKLNTNENPYPPSPKVIEAITAAVGERLRLYPDPACRELREAVARRYEVKPEQVFAGNGSDEVLAFAFAAFFASAGGALPLLFPDITYSFYQVYAGLWRVPYMTLPLSEDFSINIRDYRIPCGGVILPNPNAPTGRALPLQEILSLADYQEKRERVVIVDEAYAAFGAESAVSRIKDHPNLLTVHTLSKSASLAGLRCGFAIGQEDLIEGLCRIRDSFNSYTLDRLALAGAAAAVSDTAYYEAVNKKVIATRDRTATALSGMGFMVIPSKANFLFIRSPRKSGAAFFAILRSRGILVRHFNKPRIADFLRVSIGADSDMGEFLKACGEIS